jgi:hypothetical protein
MGRKSVLVLQRTLGDRVAHFFGTLVSLLRLRYVPPDPHSVLEDSRNIIAACLVRSNRWRWHKKAHAKGSILCMGLLVGSRNRQVFSFAPISTIGCEAKDSGICHTVNVAYTQYARIYFNLASTARILEHASSNCFTFASSRHSMPKAMKASFNLELDTQDHHRSRHS